MLRHLTHGDRNMKLGHVRLYRELGCDLPERPFVVLHFFPRSELGADAHRKFDDGGRLRLLEELVD